MTSSKLKGQKKELLAQKQLEAEGYTVFFKSHTIKQGPIYRGYDFADLFDLVAAKSNFPDDDEWKFISVKHHNSSGLGAHKDAIKEFADKFRNPFHQYELWRWKRPGYYGRGKDRKWCAGEFEKTVIA